MTKVEAIRAAVRDWAKDGTYECDWTGELDLPVSEEAEWQCPRCGAVQTTDTLPEERDPDEEWDSRYDD
jgi:rubrerythrin